MPLYRLLNTHQMPVSGILQVYETKAILGVCDDDLKVFLLELTEAAATYLGRIYTESSPSGLEMGDASKDEPRRNASVYRLLDLLS